MNENVELSLGEIVEMFREAIASNARRADEKGTKPNMTIKEKEAIQEVFMDIARSCYRRNYGGTSSLNRIIYCWGFYSLIVIKGNFVLGDKMEIDFYKGVTFKNAPKPEDKPTASLVVTSKELYANALARLKDFYSFDIAERKVYSDVIPRGLVF